jgi:hypothetical protein
MGALSPDAVARYRRDGFYFPVTWLQDKDITVNGRIYHYGPKGVLDES